MTHGFVIKLDEAELTLRFVESVVGLDANDRQAGVPPAEILDYLETSPKSEHRDMVCDLRECAKIAMHYFAEAVASGANPPGGKISMAKIDPDEGPLQ
jgi:hypothetical protein